MRSPLPRTMAPSFTSTLPPPMYPADFQPASDLPSKRDFQAVASFAVAGDFFPPALAEAITNSGRTSTNVAQRAQVMTSYSSGKSWRDRPTPLGRLYHVQLVAENENRPHKS